MIYDKPTANIILNGKKLKAFPLNQEQGKGAHCYHYYSTQLWKSQPQQSEKKEKKGIQIGKEEINLSLFANNMILYKENPKDTIRKLLELISEFKVLGYNIKTQKSLAFLYTNNEKSEREIKEAIPFTIATQRIKYLGINLLRRQNNCTQKIIRH